MAGDALPQPKFRGKLEPHNGHWWALVDHVGDIRTWAPIGSVAKLKTKDLLEYYRLARYFYWAGILESITGPIVSENGKEVTNVVKGTAREAA